MEVNKNGMLLIIKRHENESEDVFYNRLWFIISQDEQTLNNFEEIEKLSHVWANIKFLGCRYSSSLYHKIMNMEKKMYIDD